MANVIYYCQCRDCEMVELFHEQERIGDLLHEASHMTGSGDSNVLKAPADYYKRYLDILINIYRNMVNY